MFNPGDIVQLQSGGPAMTVKRRDNTGHVYVDWFDTTHKAQTGCYHEKELVKLKEIIP